jgi:hypothetical protein
MESNAGLMTCPLEKKECAKAQIKCRNSIAEPYPKMLMLCLTWMPNDITPTNCLKILASIPPHVFLSQIYNASTSILLAYKLNTIIAYTGNHYMIFMRLRNGPNQAQRTWTLFNDTDKRTFKSFAEVAKYLVEANVAPTLLMFEQSPYNDSRINQNNIWV